MNGFDNEDFDEDDEGDLTSEIPCLCWSCRREFVRGQGVGVSLDDTDDEQICDACWQLVPVTSRMVLGLLFRHLDQGGLGLADLIEEALRSYPMNINRRGEGRN